MFRCDGEKRGDGNHNTTAFSTIGEDKQSCDGEASPTLTTPVSSTSATSSTDTSAATSIADGTYSNHSIIKQLWCVVEDVILG